ncbi:hypothetical protein MKY04_11955 [Lysinibacillus telephonicus]|uniref:hypothetical protein n=1 Tax=Lysinibacillus telephonicus TaxID=1714840 RepID=UPI0031FE4061
MNIHEALKSVQWDRAEYFKYKFPQVRFDQSKPQKSEEEFLKVVGKKTMNPYTRWEKSEEYKALVSLMLQGRSADDLQEVYEVVVANAKTGDDKAVKLFMALQKEIDSYAKMAIKSIEVKEEDEDADDLILD